MKLALDAVSVTFGTDFVLQSLSTELRPADFVGLVGPNGAGKSTLLRAMGGLIDISGHVRLDGRELRTIDPAQRARQIAYLAQATPAAWPISVSELVGLGRLPHRGNGDPRDDRRAVLAALERMSLTSLAHRAVTRLSGGEHARAQIARALCVEAPILLADEPIAKLDPYHQLQIMDLLRTHAREGHLVIAVLHDLALAARYCDRLLLLDAGRVIADGSPASVLTAPRLRSVYRIDAIVDHHEGEPLIVPWRQCG